MSTDRELYQQRKIAADQQLDRGFWGESNVLNEEANLFRERHNQAVEKYNKLFSIGKKNIKHVTKSGLDMEGQSYTNTDYFDSYIRSTLATHDFWQKCQILRAFLLARDEISDDEKNEIRAMKTHFEPTEEMLAKQKEASDYRAKLLEIVDKILDQSSNKSEAKYLLNRNHLPVTVDNINSWVFDLTRNKLLPAKFVLEHLWHKVMG